MASYRVEVDREITRGIRKLPGNVRQRVLRALQDLRENPRPANSRTLDVAKAGVELAAGAELRRIRLEAWRIVYLVEEADYLISVLAVRKRPPYQYEDLEDLVRVDLTR